VDVPTSSTARAVKLPLPRSPRRMVLDFCLLADGTHRLVVVERTVEHDICRRRFGLLRVHCLTPTDSSSHAARGAGASPGAPALRLRASPYSYGYTTNSESSGRATLSRVQGGLFDHTVHNEVSRKYAFCGYRNCVEGPAVQAPISRLCPLQDERARARAFRS
jgi:hypothetical protein